MYSFPNFEPVYCSRSSSNCCFLTCSQVSQEAGQMVWYSHLFKSFPQFVMIHTVKDFSVVSEAEVDVFLELSCFFEWSNGCWQFDLWFPCLFFSAWTSASSHFTYCWSLAWRILSITLIACEMSVIVLCGTLNICCYCPSLELGWKLTFSRSVVTAEFSKFAGILSTELSQHHLLGFEIAQLEFHHLH